MQLVALMDNVGVLIDRLRRGLQECYSLPTRGLRSPTQGSYSGSSSKASGSSWSSVNDQGLRICGPENGTGSLQ